MQVKVHPAADAFPMMNAEQYEGLKRDIEERGQQEAIVYWQGQLVDGRNRLKACQELKIEPTECELDESTDPVAYVISANLHRRHLTTAQRSMVAAKLATLKRGRPSKDENSSNDLITSDVAKLLQVSEPSVKRAKQVVERGSKELVQAVERGEVNLNQAVNLTKAVESKSEQSKIVREGKDAIKAAVAAPKAKPKAPAEKDFDAKNVDAQDFDDQLVKGFDYCNDKLNTIARMADMLETHETFELVKKILSPHEITELARELNMKTYEVVRVEREEPTMKTYEVVTVEREEKKPRTYQAVRGSMHPTPSQVNATKEKLNIDLSLFTKPPITPKSIEDN